MRAPITPMLADATPITDLEMAFGTTRLLPPPEAIPEPFWSGNLYTQLAEALFYRHPLPPALIEFRHGFDSQQLRRIVLSHLRSFAAKHEHKIAGVGYLISQMAILTPAPVDAAAVPVELPT